MGFKIRFQVSIVIAITAMLSFLTIATALGIYTTSTRAAQDSAQRLFSEITARIADQVNGQMTGLLDLADLGASLSASGDSLGKDIQTHKLAPFLRRSLQQNANLYATYVGHADGAFLQMIAAKDDEAVRTANKAPVGTHFILRGIRTGQDGVRREQLVFLDGQGIELGRTEKDNPNYDPRQRDWYKDAVGQSAAKLSEPYIFASLKAPGLTASRQAAADGAVFAVNIALKGLSNFIASQSVSPQGGLVLFDSKRRLLAISPTLTKGMNVDINALPTLDSLNTPLIAAILAAKAGDGARTVETSLGSTMVQVGDIRVANGQTISIGIVAPFADFTGPIEEMQLRILKIAGLVLLLVIPLSMLFARNVARSVRVLAVEAERVRNMDFEGHSDTNSHIVEFDQLGGAFALMKDTLSRKTHELRESQEKLARLVDLGIAMSSERDSNKLMEMVLLGAKELTNADGGTLYTRSDDDKLQFQILRNDTLGVALGGTSGNAVTIPPVPMFDADGNENHRNVVSHAVHEQATINIVDAYDSTAFDFSGTRMFDERNGYRSKSFMTVPLKPRGGDVIGALQLINARPTGSDQVIPFSPDIQRFVEALAAQAATALYNRELLAAQERLMDAMIQLIAGAIDAKSPYTGGHCERVPELAIMLAQEATNQTQGPLADFRFTTEEEWREFRIGAWLHDCGKVVTPEYIVDKATKLETIYDRIHEVRTRFEVLLRDAKIASLESIAAGTPPDQAEQQFLAAKTQLMDDFAFIAECNVGGEFMAPDKIERLKQIAQTTWQRYFDNRLGLGHEELKRYPANDDEALPVTEFLLSDKQQHVIPRLGGMNRAYDNLDLKVKVPENLYNMGEVYNLSIGRGTLTEEDRFKINEHVIQTIAMLERLPFPKHMKRVPEYAGTHHETLIGSGYPRKLDKDQLSIPSRIMAIADIFEALTASDRPYKKAKTLSECIKILSFFKKDGHIDGDLFDLFLTSGIYKTYAERFLLPEQMDEVDIGKFVTQR